MTREEAINVLLDVQQYHIYRDMIGECKGNLAKAIDVAIDTLRETLLPTDIDEAAEDYGNEEFPDEPFDNEYPREIAKDAFKVGAEWMAGQEEIIEGEVVSTSTNDWECIRINKKLHSVGDKVTIQIRKK